jgi:hypothetical protein
MAWNRIHGRWAVFLQAFGLVTAYIAAIGLAAGAIGVVAYTLTGGRLG